MQFITFFLASITAYSSILTGILLVNAAKEEQKPLENYFNYAKIILSVIAPIPLLILFSYSKPLFFLIVLAASIFLFLKFKIFHYAVLGILFYFSSKSPIIFPIEASIIFIYGLVYSSINYKKKNDIKSIIPNSIFFLIISNLLFFLS